MQKDADSKTTTERRENSFRLLLAEDNSINQQVARNLLKKLGFDSDVVSNGQEAVLALERIPYDLVLMDCQMPVMDGYEATAVIRDPRSRVLNHYVPIVALTAHAMATDRDKCLKAGMNEYLSKPIRVDQLAEVIGRLLTGCRVEPTRPAVSGPKQSKPVDSNTLPVVFNEADLLERLMSDKDLADSIVAGFLEDIPKKIELLRRFDTADGQAVKRICHSVKGAAANISAPALSKTAQRMEAAAERGEMETVRTLVPELEVRFIELAAALAARGGEP